MLLVRKNQEFFVVCSVLFYFACPLLISST